jgi:hypothetical protein
VGCELGDGLVGICLDPTGTKPGLPAARIAPSSRPAAGRSGRDAGGGRPAAARGIDRVDHLAGEVAEAGRFGGEVVGELGEAELAEDDDAVATPESVSG